MVSTMLRNFLNQVYMYVCILFLWIPSARLQCSSGTVLQAACLGLQSNSGKRQYICGECYGHIACMGLRSAVTVLYT